MSSLLGSLYSGSGQIIEVRLVLVPIYVGLSCQSTKSTFRRARQVHFRNFVLYIERETRLRPGLKNLLVRESSEVYSAPTIHFQGPTSTQTPGPSHLFPSLLTIILQVRYSSWSITGMGAGPHSSIANRIIVLSQTSNFRCACLPSWLAQWTEKTLTSTAYIANSKA